ncbi:MAG: MmcQ/YjbR family DNA-binding protein [Cyclobacteriaceae bacterium]|nr:MmcQ/YjbR family DNA-binding protein [Cyclobacteriaceae bacterium]MBL7866247.1 MmcQ/YjbR family DNA-binding protein [Cyclobacteriaceae bacterium]
MNVEGFRSYCLAKKGVTEEFPFDESTLVFKVMGKMFALADVDDFTAINLKVDPETGVELRERYAFVKPAFHMNKKHWMTVVLDGEAPERLVLGWIDESYSLVVKKLTKSQKLALEAL